MACRGSAVRIRYAPFPLTPSFFLPSTLLFDLPLYFMAIVGKELAIACARAAEEIQAEDIRVIDLTGISSLTDFMVVCSGTSLPHLKAVMRDVEKSLIEEFGVQPVSSEGDAHSRWVVLDYIDVMVHIMHHELRELYALEDLWSDGKDVEWQLPEN